MGDIIDIELLINECKFEASRSSGSGGQNVNKVATKVTLLFDVQASMVLTEEQKQIIFEKLQKRINQNGILHISGSRARTQFANKKQVTEKFEELISEAFIPEIERIATEPTQASKQKRKEDKKRKSSTKLLRERLRDELTDE